MSNTGTIKYIQDEDKNIVLPVTHERGVLDSNGVTLESKLLGKQATLVSGKNIKTINGDCILGEGNLVVNTGSDIDTVTVTVDSNSGTPSASGSVSGSTLSLSFHNLKGEDGNAGSVPIISIGEVTTLDAGATATASITGTTSAPVLNLGIPKGLTGNTGASGYGGEQQVTIINDVTTGGTTDALSAEQGKVLKGLIDSADAQWSAVSAGEKMTVNTVGLRGIILTISGDVYDSMSLYTVKSKAGVVGVYDDNSRVSITDFELTGLVEEGTQVFTATAGGFKATTTITVLERTSYISSITASSSVSELSRYTNLDEIRQYLTVNLVYSDTTTELTDDYTLSGEMTLGTSTITVTYNEDNTIDTTVSITGIEDGSYVEDKLTSMVNFSLYEDNYTGDVKDLVTENNITFSTSTLADASTNTPYGGIHDGMLVMSKWMESTTQKYIRPFIPSASPGKPFSIEFYGRLRAAYANGGTSASVGSMGSTAYNIFQVYLTSESTSAMAAKFSNSGEITFSGPASRPNITTSGANVPFYDSSHSTVDDLTHIVVCMENNHSLIYVNGTKVLESTATTTTNTISAGAKMVWFNDYKYVAADICMLRAYHKILTAMDIQRNYQNCVGIWGTTMGGSD